MEKKGILSKILAITGTLLVWLPLLAPVIITMIFYVERQLFRFDYLMPAELFPAGLVGGVLLIWAARRAHTRLKLIGWGLGIAIGSLVLGQALAVLTGLASGEMEPEGFWFMLLIASLAVFSLALLATGVGGIYLLVDLFKSSPAQSKQI